MNKISNYYDYIKYIRNGLQLFQNRGYNKNKYFEILL